MNQREIDALEKCIAQVNAGMPVEDCINQSAEMTPELMEILKTTSDLISLGENQASQDQVQGSLKMVLSQAAELSKEKSHSKLEPTPASLGVRLREFLRGSTSLKPLFSRMALVLGITALLILLSGGLVITSAKSLPGDSLYPVKRAVEDITVYLVPNGEIRQEYEVSYSQQRVDEVARLIALNRIQRISYEGVLGETSATTWTVSGIPVMIQADTTFVGELKGMKTFVAGSVVEVEGITNLQGGVSANEIHLRQYSFSGTVEKIDKSSWQISGIKLSITSRTQIEQGIVVGDEVNVLIRSNDEGLYALSIQSAGTPVPVTAMDPTRPVDPAEHDGIEVHPAIPTLKAVHTADAEETNHEQLQTTVEPAGDGEHENAVTLEPTESHENENHEESAIDTPEQHESLSETETP